ncbi:MAG TPA: hypothetical protein VKR06_29105 [Ktedonosporobacter sp.]|nr:hypothetical protein [Ktedonosporobacter sp.]
MSSTRKNNKWLFLPVIITLCAIVGIGAVIVANRVSQNGPHIPPCEAMRPYIEYQGITYFETFDGSLTSADLGKAITTIGDGANQAKSCMDAGATVYSVKGYPITARLAVGLMLFEPYRPTPTPSPSASPAQP